jgi:hypothetical protein
MEAEDTRFVYILGVWQAVMARRQLRREVRFWPTGLQQGDWGTSLCKLMVALGTSSHMQLLYCIQLPQ